MSMKAKHPFKILCGLIVIGMLVFACQTRQNQFESEAWVSQPQKEWPNLALTSEVTFSDKTYTDFASGFLVDTGIDTLAVTVKHVFMAFAAQGLMTVDFQGKLQSWFMYPKNQRDVRIELGELINRNPREMAAMPNLTNNSDWLVFRIRVKNPDIKPFKIGDGSVRSGEVLYTLGWTQKDTSGLPRLIKDKVVSVVGNQIFMESITEVQDKAGLSGAPVFNAAGHLVGISSGGEGLMGRSCSVFYLMEVLNNKGLLPIE